MSTAPTFLAPGEPATLAGTTVRSDDGGTPPLILAVLAILVLVIVIAVALDAKRKAPGGSEARPANSADELALKQARREGMTVSPSEVMAGDSPERRSVYAALARPYSTADVDPLIAGQLYGYSNGIRNVYAERSAHGNGLSEYSSAGGPGDVGVDVGPFGLDEYGGKAVGYDDGIPANWDMPSTPIRWYAPKQRDHYGADGPTVYSEGAYTLSEPDHDPLMN